MTRARDIADLAGAADAGTVTGKSLIINGDMAVHQRSGTITAGSGNYSLDRFQLWANGDGGFDVTQSTEAPVGFKNSLKVDVTSADTSIDAGAYKLLYYSFEGYDMSHLEWGTANAKTVTISFWVRSTTTGDHSVGIRGGDSSYISYMTTYNISSANTWEYKTVTIPGNTAASFTYASGNTIWGTLVFSFATGSTYTVTANETFEAGNLITATGAVNLFSSDSNDWYITGLKLEVGSAATPFLHESYAENLAKCQRYFQKIESLGSVSSYNAFPYTGLSRSSTIAKISCGWVTPLRSAPTVTISAASHFAVVNGTGGAKAVTSTSVVRTNDNSAMIEFTATGLTAGQATYLTTNNTADPAISVDAEL